MDKRDVFGRRTELGRVELFLDAALLGPTALLLEGDPGIGKSTLWQAAVDRAIGRGFLLLTSAPAGSEATLSFASLGDLLDPHAGEELLAALPEPQREALEVALVRRAPGRGPIDHRTVAAATLSMLRILASDRGPVVVAVDDLQRLDPSSALALGFTVRRLRAGERISQLATLRPGEEVAGDLKEAIVALGGSPLRLVPLDVVSMGRAIEARVGTKFPPTLVRKVHEVSRGNTLLALEIARTLAEQRIPMEAGVPPRAPPDLEHALRSRLAPLPDRSRKALLLASALARPTKRAITEAGGTDAEPALSAAAAAGIIELIGEEVRFVHPMFAAVLYSDAGSQEKREAHRRLAGSASDVEERARHLALAAEGPDTDVAVLLDEAGRHALTKGAPAAAGELFELAARLTPPDCEEERLGRLVRSADGLFVAGDYARVIALLEPLVSAIATGLARAEVLWRLGEAVHIGYEDHRRASALFTEAAEQEGVAAGLKSRILDSLAWAEAATSLDQTHLLAEAVDLAERADDDAALASALAHLAALRMWLGHGVDRAAFARAIALKGPLETRFAYADALADTGELDEAEQMFTELLRLATERGDEGSVGGALFGLGVVEWQRGRLRPALEHIEECASYWPYAGSEVGVAARVAATLGDVGRARGLAAVGLKVTPSNADPATSITGLGALGFLELSLGNTRAARHHLVRGWELLNTWGVGEPEVFHFPADLVEAHIAEGDLVGAEEVVTWLEERGRTLDRPLALAQGGRGRALLLAAGGDLEAAIGAIDGALRHHERIDMPFELGRTLLVQGSIRRRAKQRQSARQALGQALEIFERLEAPLWADKAREELARIAGRRAVVGELTAAERRVALLATTGRTNREIADTLFTSVRTVEGHLSHVYAKLGIRSRAELHPYADLFEPSSRS
jgi:DNA-binding CsgD family transcriptional regulator